MVDELVWDDLADGFLGTLQHVTGAVVDGVAVILDVVVNVVYAVTHRFEFDGGTVFVFLPRSNRPFEPRAKLVLDPSCPVEWDMDQNVKVEDAGAGRLFENPHVGTRWITFLK